MFFEAVLYWARVGCPWRDLPGDFGGWSAVYKRLRRWIDSGRLARLFGLMAVQPACDGTLRVMIDSTIVRAHQHAAGASEVKGGAASNAIGRSRGGLSTKIIAVATDEDGVVAVDIAEGQRNDAPLALPVLAQAKAALGRLDEVLGDKGFDSDEIRGACLDEHDALPVIPNRVNRKEPWPWDEVMKGIYKGEEPDRACVLQGEAVPPVRDPLREAPGSLPGPGATGLRIHPREEDRPIRQHALELTILV